MNIEYKNFKHIEVELNIPSLKRVDGDGQRYYVHPVTGNRYKSVTSVVGNTPAKKAGLKKWRERVGEAEAKKITKQAATKGTNTHTIIEKYLLNEMKPEKNTIEYLRLINFVPSLNRIDNIRHQELKLYSDILGLAGTTDCVAEFDGKLSIVDFKTSKKQKKEEWIQDYFMQATAYSLMYQELTKVKIPQIVIIVCADDGTADCFVKSSINYVKPLFKIIKENK